MGNKLMKSLFVYAMIVGAALGFTACEEGTKEVTNPTVEVSVSSLNFSNEEDTQSVEITANGDWKVTVDYVTGEDWVTVTPSAGNGNAAISVSVPRNDSGAIREASIKVIALHPTYGNWDVKKISVSQSSTDTPPAEETLLYGDNFDGAKAEKGEYWPYPKDFPQFANAEGPAAADVTYEGSGVTVRANSESNGSYSDYAGSGVNNIFFGKSAYFQINGIALTAEQTNLKLTFGTEKYSQDNGSLFKNEEFHVYLSADGQKWTEIEYTFAGEAEGRWNVATANFTLKEAPASLSIKFAADVASSYRLDDVKLFTGNGGQEVDLAAGNAGGGGGDTPGGEVPADAVKATVAEFLAAAEDATVYLLTGKITRVANTQWGNFDLTDDTGTVYIYGLLSPTGEEKVQWAAAGLKEGDTITVYGKRTSYNDTPQMADAVYVSHEVGTGGGNEGGEEPVTPAEGEYASDAAFVCSADDSENAVYTHGDTMIGSEAVTGFKLGTSKKAGVFTSQEVGVSGDKYLNFYAVAWKGKSATIYFKVDGGAVQSQTLVANDGATGLPPYTALSFATTDHYSFKLTGLTASSKILFSTSENFDTAESTDARAIVCGVKLTDQPLGDEGGNEGGNEDDKPAEHKKVTVKEFKEAAEDDTLYELTGTISNVIDEEYGDFDLTDATGTVAIRGLLTPDGKSKTQWKAAGLKAGDTITLYGNRATYRGEARMNDATYVSHEAGKVEDDEPVETVKATIREFKAAKEDDTLYELTGEITRVVDDTYGNFNIADETGEVYIFGLLTPNGEEGKQWKAAGLKLGDTITLYGKRASSPNNQPQMVDATYVSHVAGTEGGGEDDEKEATLAVNPTSLNFTAAGGTATITATLTNSDETITAESSNATQFAVSVSGTTITVTAAANTATTAINATITVKAGTLSQTVSVTQAAAEQQGGEDEESSIAAALESEEGASVEATGTVMAMCTKGFIISDSVASIYVYTESKPTVAVGNKVTVKGTFANHYGTLQIATPEIVSNDNSTAKPTYPNPVDLTSQSAYDAYQTFDVNNPSTFPFVKIQGTLSKDRYITVGSSTKQSMFNYSVNDYSALNGAVLTTTAYIIGYHSTNKYYQLIEVSVEAEPYVSASGGGTVAATATSTSIAIKSNVAWSVTCGASWVKSYTKSGNLDGTIAVAFDANSTTTARTAEFVITGTGVQTPVKVTVTQSASGTKDTKGVYSSMDFLFDGATVVEGDKNGKLEDATNAYKQLAAVGGTEYDVLKLGTSKANGSYTTTAVGESNVNTLSFYAVGWKGKTVKLTVTVDGKATELTLTANDGASDNPTYTITFNDQTDYYSIPLTGVTANSTITFETDSSGYRAIICGVQLR